MAPKRASATTRTAEPARTGTVSRRAPATHPVHQAQGTVGNRAVGAAMRGHTGAVRQPDRSPSPAPPKPLADRQVRKITLWQAAQTLEWLFGDASTHVEQVLRSCDFPPGTYLAKPNPAVRLGWLCPEQLLKYLHAEGVGFSVLTDAADHAKNTGTFEGVDTFVFEVVGERVERDPAGVDVDLDALLDTPTMHRYLALSGRRRWLPEGQRLADREPLPVEDVVALRQLYLRLLEFTPADWEALESQAAKVAPAGDWWEANAQLERYLRGPHHAAALSEAADRDARVDAARADIDPDAQAGAVARLRGMDDLFEAIKTYEQLPSGAGAKEWSADLRMRKEEAKKDMQRRLKESPFGSVEEFDDAVRNLRAVVQPQAVLVALTNLRQSERVLRAEAIRYGAPATVNQLATELKALPHPEDPTSPESLRVRDAYPILRDPAAYAGAVGAKYPEFLRELLRQNAQAQLGNVVKSRTAIKENPGIVFNFDLLIDETLDRMGLAKTAVQSRVIKEGRARPDDRTWPVLHLILDMVALALCFATGPLGWVAYAAGLGSFALTAVDVHTHERQRAAVTASSHSGPLPLATPPAEQAGTGDAVSLVLGALGILHVPAPGRPKAPAGPTAGESTALVRREPTALARQEAAPQARTVAPGVVEISQPGRPGVVRITPEGWEFHPNPDSGQPPALAQKWVDAPHQPVRPDLVAQAPDLANLHDAAAVSLGGKPFGVGVTAQGWFVYAPGTRTPLVTGRFSPRTAARGAAEGATAERAAVGHATAERAAVGHATAEQAVAGRATAESAAARDAAGHSPAVPARPQLPEPAAPLPEAPSTRHTDFVPGNLETADPSVSTAGTFTLTGPRIPAEADDLASWEVRVSATTPGGQKGTVVREWERETNTFTYVHSDLSHIPKESRWVPTDPPMVPGMGTPLEAYLSMRAMNWFERQGANFSGPRLVRMVNVTNERAILELARALKEKPLVPLDLAVLETHSVQYANNAIVQRGGRITGVKVLGNDKVPASAVAGPDQLARYGIDPDERVLVRYTVELTVELTVEPVHPGPTRPSRGGSGGGSGGPPGAPPAPPPAPGSPPAAAPAPPAPAPAPPAAAPAPPAPAAGGPSAAGPLIVDLQSGPLVGVLPNHPGFGQPGFLPRVVESTPGARGVAIEGGDFLLGFPRPRPALFDEADRLIPGVHPTSPGDLALSRQIVQSTPPWPPYTAGDVGRALSVRSEPEIAAAPFSLHPAQIDPGIPFPRTGRTTVLTEPGGAPAAFFPPVGGESGGGRRLVPLDQTDVVALRPSTHPQLHGLADQIYWRRPFALTRATPDVARDIGAELNRMLRPGGFVEFRVLEATDVPVAREVARQIEGARVVEVPQEAIRYFRGRAGQRRPGLTDEQWQILQDAAPDLQRQLGALGQGTFDRIVRIYRTR